MKLLLTLNEVSEAVGFSVTKINSLMRAGRFPMSVRIDGNVRWRTRDIQDWVNNLCVDQEPNSIDKPKRGRKRLAI